MKKDNEKTVVIFKKDKGDNALKDNGQVFAVFPAEPFDLKGNVTSYSHAGQHSACSLEYVRECTNARWDEYQDLKKELESLGYNLLDVQELLIPEFHVVMQGLHVSGTHEEEYNKKFHPEKVQQSTFMQWSDAKCEELFFDALCNGVGSGYMSGYGLEFDVDPKDYKEAKRKLKSPSIEDVWMQVLRDGKPMKCIDHEYDGEYTRTITMKDVYDRVPHTPLRHLTDAMKEEGDAVTADVIVQQVFFNEVVFG